MKAERKARDVGKKRDREMEAEVCDRYISLCACLPPAPLAYHQKTSELTDVGLLAWQAC